MNLTSLTDEQLMIDTKALVNQENKLLVKILYHIKEIDRRKLFSVTVVRLLPCKKTM